MSSTTNGSVSHAAGTPREAEILEDIRQLEEDMATAQEMAGDLPSRLESGVLIALGGLGLLGAGQATSWLLQRPGEEGGPLAQADFALSILAATQRGLQSLGDGGRSFAFSLGCLVIFALVGRQFLTRRPEEDEGSVPPSFWPAWALGLTLVMLPFYDFSKIQPAVNFFVGVAVSCGLYAVVLLLQRSATLQELFSQLDHRWIWGTLGAVMIGLNGLIASGFLGPNPRWAYLGIVLASCLSIQMLSLGLKGKASAEDSAVAGARRRLLYRQLAEERKEQRIREDLRRFIRG
ncbi:MAG TPA: hypothetical protein DD490_16255 [Acidobacteria bacterium]|nr:hypothetical protein [Acidobacteriota bacterium]